MIHKGSHVMEVFSESWAKVVQTVFTIRCTAEAVFGTLAPAGKQEFAVPA
jgi:hypothetical protein